MTVRKRLRLYKDAFERETGFNAGKNPELYFLYVTARIHEDHYRATKNVLKELKELNAILGGNMLIQGEN